jgi:signal peptidase I
MSYIIGVALITFLALSFVVFFLLFSPVEVLGHSMYPTLHSGEMLLGKRIYNKRNRKNYKVDDIYVFYQPNTNYLVIKRLTDIQVGMNNEPLLYFMGDNRYHSYDSRVYGYVDTKYVQEKIIRKRKR